MEEYESSGKAAGRVGICTLFAARAGARAHGENIVVFSFQYTHHGNKTRRVLFGSFFDGFEIEIVLHLADRLHQHAERILFGALCRLLDAAARRRTAPVASVGAALVRAAHIAHFGHKDHGFEVEFARRGKTFPQSEFFQFFCVVSHINVPFCRCLRACT